MRVNLIYASTSGNVEIVMETIAWIFRQKGLGIFLERAEKASIKIINDHQCFVFGTSTWEHGQLNPYFAKLYEKMEDTDFKGKNASFVGLGDKRYEPILFCGGIKKIRELWLKNGGEEVASELLISGEPYDQLDNVVKPWASKLALEFSNSHG